MPPKNKGKKGKKGDDDFWEKADQTVEPNALATTSAVDDDDGSKSKGGISGYAALSMTDDADAVAVEEEEDFGGLMSVIKATSKGKKDKKKVKKGPIDATNGVPDGSVVAEGSDGEGVSASKGPIEVTAEDLADEEWGPVKEKNKKDKKGKGKKSKQQDEVVEDEKDEEEKVAIAPVEHAAPPEDGDENEDAEDTGTRVLSKKEKEKLKKEREKAKKKAQAAAKKATDTGNEPASPAVTTNEAAPSKPEGDDDADDPGDGKADSKKKKKKKAKKDDEPAPAPAPTAATTKKKGGISALKAMMEEKKRLEEEAKRREEEERKRIEEEERLAEEAARKKEEERQRRKEKEKTKREVAKKEGRLLTKKQKEEKQMAEIRKQALIASGAQIEGLQAGAGASAAKKVVYGNRKKKGPSAKEISPTSSRPRSPEPQPAVITPPPPAEEPEAAADTGAQDDWDASNDDEAAKPTVLEGVKDSWDDSSDEEGRDVPAAPSPTEKAAPAPTPNKLQAKGEQAKGQSQKPEVKATSPTKAAPVPKGAPATKGTQPSKAAPADESEDDSSSEGDSSSELSESDSEDDSSDESSSDEELTQTQKMVLQRKAQAAERRAKAREAALAARSKDDLRSPICCILGHVDTGKTSLLDKIRQTNVQEGEAGGITQQIGATYFPVDAIKTKTTVMNKDNLQEYKIPGLLIIDTPGHESFTNLRSRGSSLCNIAVLVVDIMHGLEPQTLESLRLLRDRKTPFIVALNKVDRLFGWEATPDGAFRESLAKQPHSTQREFEDRVAKTIVAFAEEGLNACLYYENKNFARNVSLVPTSARTGEGIPDMIMLLVNLTQQRMSDSLMYLSELECTVLEVKMIEGLGTTIDVVLSNGVLREGDRIVVCGLNGPIVTQVRALLTPQPLRELRIKSAYVHHKEVKAALGVKVVAPDLEKAIAGSRLLVVGPDDDEDDLRDEVMSDLTSLLNSIDKSGRGVCVQASTLGSLEALLDFLKASKIPVSGINIGPVHKKDIMRAATMLEKAKELACILCFDVPVDKDADRLAEEMGIHLFKADIIYHLFDAFTKYNNEITEAKRRDAAPQAVWPCRLKIIAAFCKRDPIILGVDILDGSLRVGTPLAVVKTDAVTGKKDIVALGKITSLEINHKTHDIVKKAQSGGGVAVKIEHAVYQSAKMFGRHFDDKDEILSHISRQSIDVLKNSFKADVSNEEWLLIRALKPRFNIS